MKKWKIAFWVCLTTLLLVLTFGLYTIIDQGTTLAYMKESYTNTENDLANLTKIVNETDLTKDLIRKSLSKHQLFEYMNFNSDTISLDRITLIFENNKLKKITKQW